MRNIPVDLCETAEESLFNQVLYKIHYVFCISFFHFSLQQARITTSDHVGLSMIKNYEKKQLI